MRNRNTSIRYPGGWKVLWGVAAYVVGYLCTLLAFGRGIEDILQGATVSTQDDPLPVAAVVEEAGVSAVTGAGWLFYNSHFVSITVPRPDQNPVLVNLVLEDGGSTLALLGIPPLLLIAAGIAVTRTASTYTELRFDLGGPKARYALNGGVVTMLGYLPLAILGAIVFGVSADIRVAPDLFWTFALAGLVYPFVFGAIGGLLVSRGAERPSMEERGMGWGNRE